MKKRLSVWLSCVLVMVLVVSFSIPVYALPASEDKTISVSKSRSNLGYSSCNYGDVQMVDGSLGLSSGSTLNQSDYYFHYFDYLGFGFHSSSDVYAYRVQVYLSGVSVTSSNVIQQSYVLDTWENIVSGNARSIISSMSNDSVAGGFYIVNNYATVTYYLGLLSYCRYYHSYTQAGGHLYSYASYNTSGTLRLVITPFSEAGFIQAIGDQTTSINNTITQQTQNQTNSINNQISQETQKQTDTVTKGYDSSGMDADNDRLSSSLDSYESAESQVMDQSNTFIDAVTFFDVTTHYQLMACMTYVATFLQDLFVALGDWSILVMLALSLAFALMLIGWFKYRK